MHITLMGLFQMRAILSRELLGINVETGERKAPNLKLPVSMKRHLRRLMEAVTDEMKIAEPERVEFITKWKVYGENKDELPKPGENPEYEKEYMELFFAKEFVIPFSPFHLELLDNHNEVIPDDVEGMMQEMNDEFERQNKKEDNPAKGDSDTAASTAKANA
jgi:hypothetical protein